HFQILAIVGNSGETLGPDVIQCVSQRHLSIAMVMPVCLAVRGNVNHLGPVAIIRKSVQQTVGKLLAIIQQMLEGDSLRDGPVVEEQIHPAARWEFGEISASGVDTA